MQGLTVNSSQNDYHNELPLINQANYKGDTVRLLQSLLLSFDYKLTFNATYDSATKAAVTTFQTNHEGKETPYGKMIVDGEVGPITWYVLTDEIKSK